MALPGPETAAQRQARLNLERFWADLLSSIERRRVIPVIGAELLIIQERGQPVPLYRAVADRLLKQYAVKPPAQERYGLFEAVSTIAASEESNVKVHHLYWSVHEILQQLTAEHPEALDPLRELATITHFDLFVTTTPDDLLARAVNAVHFGGTSVTSELEYAPKLPGTRCRDIPEDIADCKAVFYLFGKADAGPFFAIHDEDALEFAYRLQTGSGPERMFSRIRDLDLLLIGCTFAEGLNRFFLRLSNTDRLSDNRIKREYLVGRETTLNKDFVVFLERFSQNSRCHQMDAGAFVSELRRQWLERNPPSVTPEPGARRGGSPAAGASAGGGIFISYAKEDLVAARRVFERLQGISDAVSWFDKNDLKIGDVWDQRIRLAIQKCDLFIPLLSATTEDRDEGYFRSEWRTAAERLKMMEGRPFIVPLVVDPDYHGDLSRYGRVPEAFKPLQYGHAPRGEMSDALLETIRDMLRELRRGRPQ